MLDKHHIRSHEWSYGRSCKALQLDLERTRENHALNGARIFPEHVFVLLIFIDAVFPLLNYFRWWDTKQCSLRYLLLEGM